MAEIQKINYTHERIMDWLVLNPDKPLRMCAEHFNFTQAWLSSVIHSDAFQAQWRERNSEIHSHVMREIPGKLEVIADLALDKLAEHVARTDDKEFLLETSDKILNRMGYGPKAAIGRTQSLNVQNNTFVVSAQDLALARGNFGQPATMPLTFEGELADADQPAAQTHSAE